ncbi:S-phase kinase-associated protein 2 [Copidosoma floridanum]|uniref:S-phase kinase-associated protein 2 n=1 Tax=Copidosoma floridanum TaxID=29053 RepID=UPI0006C9AA11|nr:S-phase kinase-associated protein 2 [Copidosoma floridanum]
MQAQPRKRMRLDNGCNNNVNSPEIKETESWSCSGDTSLIEPEMLEDMGVGMLVDGEASRDSLKTLQTQECTIPPKKFEAERCLKNVDSMYGSQESHKSASFEVLKSLDVDRLDAFETNEVNFSSTNESGYSSRIESENFSECKENFTTCSNDATDKTCTDSYLLYKRKKKKSIVGEDKFNIVSDEIILMIFKWLPKKSLVRSMSVCKRWHQIARDEVLWTRLDLGGKILGEGALGHIIPRGVQILRLAKAEVEYPAFFENSDFFMENYVSRLQYLDLSMAVIFPEDLACLFSKCKYLKKLSLEKCTVNQSCCENICKNKDMEVLNLTMCEGLNLDCVKYITNLSKLSSLSIAWCGLGSESMDYLCKYLPSSVTRLNIAGCKQALTDENLKDLVKKCPGLVELDLSDCSRLTENAIHAVSTLEKLEHLSFSRCYSIPTPMHCKLPLMPNLRSLDIFGLLSEDLLKAFRSKYSNVELNKFMFSSVARPTVRDKRTSIWGLRVRD